MNLSSNAELMHFFSSLKLILFVHTILTKLLAKMSKGVKSRQRRGQGLSNPCPIHRFEKKNFENLGLIF